MNDPQPEGHMTSHIERRKFLATLGGAAATWPLAARAQQANVARIGFLDLGVASTRLIWVEALRAGLRDLGYVEGRNIVFEFRWAETVEQLPDLAAELVQMNVDVIFATSSTMVEAARKRPKRSLSYSPSMPTPSASGVWRAWRDPAGTSPG